MQPLDAHPRAQARIMVVDDDPPSLRLIEGALRRKGYDVRAFPLGRLALAAASRQPPDLILLDVTMPELSGYEVCGRLKADAALSMIPVIFLTGRDETGDKLQAFQAGGVDHLSKPIQIEEVYARVETHLRLRELQCSLERQNEELEITVASRTRQLAEANARLTMLDRAKSDFLTIISHELRTPLNGLLGASELLFCQLPDSDDVRELRGLHDRSQQRILSLLDDALLLTCIDARGAVFRPLAVSLVSVLARAMERAGAFADLRRVSLKPPLRAPGVILGEKDLLVRAIHALLETAVKFSAERTTVAISCEATPEALRLTLDSCGRSIPESALHRFFDVFSIGDALTPGGDLGLGPPLACRILALFGASVTIANRGPAAVRLEISFRHAETATPPPAPAECGQFSM